MYFIRRLNTAGKESGQVLILFAVLLPLLLLFVGLGIDFGLAYLTKAQLARAADAAALTAMLQLGQGQTVATNLGTDVFNANRFLGSSMYASAPIAHFTFTEDADKNPIVNVAATATINTFFIRLAGITTLTLDNASQATRPPVILSMVLDRSGSMGSNGGGAALPPAVREFLYYFIEGTDQLGEVSFSYTDTTDVGLTKSFLTPINNSLTAMNFVGATFGYGGLVDAQTQVTGVLNPPANAVKVVVFFTDGNANTIQDPLACSKTSSKVVNYGGQDSGTGYGIWLSTDKSGTDISKTCAPTKFPSQNPVNGGTALAPVMVDLNRTNITTEGEYRSVTLANAMRAQGITVYSIGLGTDSTINKDFLRRVADDPSSSTFDDSTVQGIAEFAPTPSDLSTAFQLIAKKILLRLTH